MEEEKVIGCTEAGFKEEHGKFSMFENLQKHVYFVNEMSIERTKRKFLERFVRRLPIEQLEAVFNFKMTDIELEGQYKEGSKFECELMDKKEFLKGFWDHIDVDQTANRKEYSEEEQSDIINSFLNKKKPLN